MLIQRHLSSTERPHAFNTSCVGLPEDLSQSLAWNGSNVCHAPQPTWAWSVCPHVAPFVWTQHGPGPVSSLSLLTRVPNVRQYQHPARPRLLVLLCSNHSISQQLSHLGTIKPYVSVAKNISLDTIDNYVVTLLCPAQLSVPITHNCPRYS